MRKLSNDVPRLFPLKKLKTFGNGCYEDMADLAVIFNHEVIEDHHNVVRWKPNKLVSRIWEDSMVDTTPGVIDLNQLALLALKGEIPLEEYMKFNMQIGYSLSGYAEVFGQREVTSYKLDYLSPPPEDHDFNNEYYQTPLEYMRIKYKGQVLKL